MTNNNLLVPLTITAALIAAAVAIKTHFFGKNSNGNAAVELPASQKPGYYYSGEQFGGSSTKRRKKNKNRKTKNKK